MVRLLSLHAQNFKKLKFEESLRFGDGLTVISGLNESGKSTILDAILYGFYGRVMRPPPERGRTRNEDIIGYGADEATVTIEFGIGEREFRVMRRIYRTRPSKASLEEMFPHAQKKTLAAGQEKVTEEIEGLMGGITFNELVSSNVVAQKDLNRLIELRRDDRRKVINVFLNLESFNQVLERLNEQWKNLEGTTTRPGLIRLEREKMENLRRKFEEYQRYQVELQRLEQELNTLTMENRNLKKELEINEDLLRKLTTYGEALSAWENLSLQLENKRTLLENALRHVQSLREQMDQTNKALEKYMHLSETEPKIRIIGSKLEDLERLNLEASEIDSEFSRLEAEIQEIRQSLPQGAGEKLVERHALTTPRSLRPYTGIAAGAALLALAAFFVGNLIAAILLGGLAGVGLALLAMRISDMSRIARANILLGQLELLRSKEKERSSTLEQKTKLDGDRQKLEAEIALICSAIPGFQGEDVAISETAKKLVEMMHSKIQEAQGLRVRYETLRAELQRSPSPEEIDQLKTDVKKFEQKLQLIVAPALPEGLTYSKELRDNTLKKKEELAKTFAANEARATESVKRVSELRNLVAEREEVERQLKDQEAKIGRLEREAKIIRKAVEGVQATAEALRNRVKPSVQAYMGQMMPALTDNRYRIARLDDEYNLQVWDPEAGEYKAKEVFSGGTEDQFLLAMRLAFAMSLLPESKGQMPQFLFLDEPLGSADEIRRSGILEYLSLDLKTRFRQIFLISHVSGLEEIADNTVRMEDGRITT